MKSLVKGVHHQPVASAVPVVPVVPAASQEGETKRLEARGDHPRGEYQQ